MAKEIKLTRGKVAIVDDEDFEELNKYKWQCYSSKKNKTFYATRTDYANGKRSLRMHREIFKKYNQVIIDEIDHIDRDGLNNTKINLRHCNRFQNSANVDPIGLLKSKGVCMLYKKYKLKDGTIKTYTYFRARIHHHNKVIPIGLFKTEQEASIAYDIKAKELNGDFAFINNLNNG